MVKHIRTHILLVAALAVLSAGLTGCDREPRIDATTERSTIESIDHIASLMSEDDADTFRAAIDVLAMHEMADVLDEPGDLTPEQQRSLSDERLRARLHNRTANDVVNQVLDIHEDRTTRSP